MAVEPLSSVLSSPFPNLDETGAKEQLNAFSEALQHLTSSDVTFTSIPAGAGSGKTRTLTAIIVGLIRSGTSPDHIESISFTNASADDFQSRVITSLVDLSRMPDSAIQPRNLGFSTIHKHAIDLLAKLEPHIGGVAYYFEDANESGSVSGDKEIETLLKQKSIRLAFYASIEYGQQDVDLFTNLEPFMENDDLLKRFVMEDMVAGNHRAKAKEFIRRNAMTDVGLGAFTNIDDNNPDFCIAVAVDSLMRLALETKHIAQESRLQMFGLPRYLLVDEGQDLDFLQLLYLRALAINGISIVVVGDPRQTLYEFRHSISEWPFQKDFMESLFEGTSVVARMSSSPLLTNYRSRKQIVDLAESISERLVEYSDTRPESTYLRPINDPEESVLRSHAFTASSVDDGTDKWADAISFIQGGRTKELDFLERKTASAKPKISGALGRVLQRSDDFAHAENKPKKAKKVRLSQIPALSGGDNQSDIENLIHTLYERAQAGENVCILTRNGVAKDDLKYLREVLRKRLGPSIDVPSTVKFTLLSPEKQAPLSGYWYMDNDLDAYQGVPFSSILIGAAMNFFMSWDRESTDSIKLAGLKEISEVTLSVTLEEAEKNLRRYTDPIKSIKLELAHYFDAVFIDWQEYFPESSEDAIMASQDKLVDLAARFVLDVLKQYSFRLMKQSRGGIFQRVPCRFQSCTTQYNQERGGRQLRPMNETKRYFKAFWEALANTAFPFSIEDRQILVKAGIPVEWSEPNTTLLNFPQALSIWRETQELRGSTVEGDTLNRADDFIIARETIHEQFSKVWHHKTRTYLREIAKRVGMLTRQSPETEPSLILFACFERKDFHDARNKARVSTYKSVTRSKEEYRGLYEDLKKGMRDINVESAGRKLSLSDNDESGVPEINLTTIHSSKGLEWDHVLLYFPEPSPQDTDSSFKSVRDLLYVAITRAKKTLNVVIGKDNFKSPGNSDTAFKIAKHLISEFAKERNLFDRQVEWESRDKEKLKTEEHEAVEVLPQTSHSELEKAMSCRMHHYVQHNRSLSSMVPLTAPSYSFFFHNTLSSICAGLMGHRLSLQDDPIMQMVRLIDSLATKSQLTEIGIRRSFADQCGDAVLMYMQSLVPMYFLSGDGKFQETIQYYTEQFIKQISSIIVGSSIFNNLITAKRLGGHQVWIEKPIKDVLSLLTEDGMIYMPVIGIPDLKISGPEVNYVCDYKTVPTLDDDNAEQVRQELVQISIKTHSQINLYQGLRRQDGALSSAEVIYVADITLSETATVPIDDPVIPSFTGNRDFDVNCSLESAIVLRMNRFDDERFEQTVEEIYGLREDAHENEKCPHADLYHATPLVGEDYMEVTQETCQSCGSAIHCQLKVEGV